MQDFYVDEKEMYQPLHIRYLDIDKKYLEQQPTDQKTSSFYSTRYFGNMQTQLIFTLDFVKCLKKTYKNFYHGPLLGYYQ